MILEVFCALVVTSLSLKYCAISILKKRNLLSSGLLFFLFFNVSTSARQSFEFKAGEPVQVLSDKAFRKTRENLFEAIGNVIINQGTNAIYGEKATVSFLTGDAEVVGHVRYVGGLMTMYGSRLNYNFNSQRLDVYNAKVISDNYVVLGKELSRISPTEIIGKDAEYTTCRDCPESWSVFGREVNITVGEYIRIRHAYIKVKGVVVLYVPYIVLPIKKNRESGLLFPSFGLNLDEGARFQQPFFWAINDQMDMTLSPSFFGNRGFGNGLEFRHIPRDGMWYQVDTLAVNDGIYLEGKEDRTKSGTNEFRYLGQWEHHYFSGKNWNHHFVYNENRDFDFLRDYQFYSTDKILGPDTGLETFLDWRNDYFSVSTEAGFRENQLYREAKTFDDRYVQLLPRVTMGLNSLQLIQTKIPGLRRVSVDGDIEFSVFKQNNIAQGQFIRNAHRIHSNPTLKLNMGNIGPVSVTTQARLDMQYYHFPTLSEANWYSKRGLFYETELNFVLDKIFGLSYEKKVPRENIIIKSDEEKDKEKALLKLEEKKNLLGELPELDNSTQGSVRIASNSYRHRQNYKLKHYFLSDQDTKGNRRFGEQILSDNGQFDPLDAIRSREFLGRNETSRTTLPLNNTLELQWNNSLIRKSSNTSNLLDDGRTLRDNFNYSSVGYFNVSQGIDFYRDFDEDGKKLTFEDRLTRLYITTGFNVGRTSLGLSEYFFYDTQEHIANFNVSQSFDYGSLSTGLRYNSFRVPIDKFLTVSGSLQLSDLITLNSSWAYDIGTRISNSLSYGVLYKPRNNCWMLQLDFLKTMAEKRFSFNFLINFNENNFVGMQQQ